MAISEANISEKSRQKVGILSDFNAVLGRFGCPYVKSLALFFRKKTVKRL